MANFYRNYLKERGVLTKLEDVKDDLPLYIEALGSMEITEKILTFPVTVSIPLTKFEDIAAMYDDFTDAINKLAAKAEEYQALADAENKDLLLKKKYQETADEYVRLAGEVQNITNINFRLTGFANGGMKYTYPAKVRWDRLVAARTVLSLFLILQRSTTPINPPSAFSPSLTSSTSAIPRCLTVFRISSTFRL